MNNWLEGFINPTIIHAIWSIVGELLLKISFPKGKYNNLTEWYKRIFFSLTEFQGIHGNKTAEPKWLTFIPKSLMHFTYLPNRYTHYWKGLFNLCSRMWQLLNKDYHLGWASGSVEVSGKSPGDFKGARISHSIFCEESPGKFNKPK